MLPRRYDMLRVAIRRRNNVAHGFLSLVRNQSYTASEIAEMDRPVRKLNKDLNRFRADKDFKENFVQNLFLGVIQPEILEYPEIKNIEQVDYLKEHCEKVKLVMEGSKHDGFETKALELRDVLSLLAENEFVGMKMKREREGLGYYESESCYVQEFLSQSPSLSRSLAHLENFGFSLIHLFGSDAQKEKYMPKILNGECVICTAHTEKNAEASWDSKSLETVAVQLTDDSYAISGEKTLVYNPKNADKMIVSARTSSGLNESDGDGDDKNKNKNVYTLFLVDKEAQGLTISEPFNKMGLQGVEICDVALKDVKVSKDDIIGGMGEGDKIMETILSKGAMNNGAQCIALMRSLVNESITYSIENNLFKKPLYKHFFVQGKIGQLVCKLYEAESMTYLMTGRADTFKNSNVFLESLIVKVFNSEALNFIFHEHIQLSDRVKKCDFDFLERSCRDSYYYNSFDDANEYLKMHLIDTGMKYLRDQMQCPTVEGFTPKNALQMSYFKYFGIPRQTPILRGYLNLVYERGSFSLEACISYLNYWSEILLRKYGEDVMNRTWELSQLGEMLIMIYSLCACLGRASRSLCIGLAYTETEYSIARSIYVSHYERFMALHQGLLESIKTEDEFHKLGDGLLKSGKYSPSHPVPLVTA